MAKSDLEKKAKRLARRLMVELNPALSDKEKVEPLADELVDAIAEYALERLLLRIKVRHTMRTPGVAVPEDWNGYKGPISVIVREDIEPFDLREAPMAEALR